MAISYDINSRTTLLCVSDKCQSLALVPGIAPGTLHDSDRDVRVGTWSNVGMRIACLTLYNVALSAEEIVEKRFYSPTCTGKLMSTMYLTAYR